VSPRPETGSVPHRSFRLLVTAGPTHEPIDEVRYIGNRSSGRLGAALVDAAASQGWEVVLLLGPGACEPSYTSVRVVRFQTTGDLEGLMREHAPWCDALVMAAAVADVKPAVQSSTKLPKADLPDSLPLKAVPDIVADLSRRRQAHQTLIGFAAQTGDILPPALDKLQRKGLDAIVANPIDQPESGFGSDRNQAVLLKKTGEKVVIPPCSKLEMAHRIYDAIYDALI